MLYNNLSEYFRKTYGSRLTKICIDGGFSCPNRDGVCGVGGCIYCGERGAGEHIDPSKDITDQVKSALKNGSESKLYVAYFQNFTNTYAPIDILRQRYDAALIDKRIKALAIGTRPDCIDRDVCELLASYRDKVDIWVELGLQTASDKTAEIINRGYKRDTFGKAIRLLSEYNIPVVVHLIIGLPGEHLPEIIETCRYISQFDIWGIKIHSIYVARGTRLCDMFDRGEYTPPSIEEYVESCVYILTHINPKIIIHRLTGDCPPELLVAPEWNRDKHLLISLINKKMNDSGLFQGCNY